MVAAVPRLTAENRLPRLLGGELCLDFLNTVDPRHAEDRIDYLADYPALVRWAGHASAITPGRAGPLLRAAADQPRRAEAVVQAAAELREQLYRGIRAALAARAMPPPSLRVLNDAVAAAHKARQLGPAGGSSLTWHWRDPERLDLPLLAVALSAADLLTRGALGRVRECPGTDGCGWLFLDTSKSGTRRWCSMRVCGNRAKVRRHRMP
jgi:predicted RNA-binding Zn ribbon-like protein